MNEMDVSIIGGGIVGLATGLAITTRFPGKRVTLVDKESGVAAHQTGHNSGVIHSGVYYRPGTLKAKLCVEGGRTLTAFCQSHGIPVQRCGKVIVATSPSELPRLEELHRRGTANGVVGLALIGPEQLRECEPHAAGIRALWVPSAAIVDYRKVAETYAHLIESNGGQVRLGTCVKRILRHKGKFLLHTNQGEIESRALINCAGLHADRLAHLTHSPLRLKILPFRGEYFELIHPRRPMVRGLIYPVPDPRLPFLGVHLSRRIDGRVEAGPNAVLALKREGYRKTDIDCADLLDTVLFPGFWRMTARYWRTALEETIRSLSKASFVRSLQRLVPEIQASDLVPSQAGVRAQAVERDGSLLDDFHLIQEDRLLHVVNAPSPAATASLAIGDAVADAASQQFFS